jgi:hypothetical protein
MHLTESDAFGSHAEQSEAWDADQAREKPTARQNRSPWLHLEGFHTVGDLTLNGFDGVL